MDLNRIYSNRKLEARRLSAVARLKADSALRDAKRRHGGGLKSQIENAFDAESAGCGAVYHRIRALIAGDDDVTRRAFEQLMRHLARVAPDLCSELRHLSPVHRLSAYSAQWLRAPTDWKANSHNVARQFASLARYLLCRYDVPSVFDSAWMDDDQWAQRARSWFIHIGNSANIRTAVGLPFALTKMMAHRVMEASSAYSITQALRYGQARGFGASVRIADALTASFLRVPQLDETFWHSFVQFVANQAMFDPAQVAPLADYIHNQRFVAGPDRYEGGRIAAGAIPQPNFSLKGRSVEVLLRQMRAWHRELGRIGWRRSVRFGPLIWPSTCGVALWQRREGTPPDERLFNVVELNSTTALIEEGSAMRHCVASYDRSCASGERAIFALREHRRDGMHRRLTIDVVCKTRTVVEARGRCNAYAEPLDVRLLRAWAAERNVTIADYVFRK